VTAVSSLADLQLEFEQPADAAAAKVQRALLGAMEANLPGAIDDPDSESLHDLRVAVRRSRSVQRQLKRDFPPVELDHFRAEFRWLQGLTGPARDLDVYVLGFDDLRALVPDATQGDLDPLLDVLRHHREQAREAMAEGLRSVRFTTLMSEWAALLELLPSMPVADRPDAKRAIGELAGTRIVKVYKRMVKTGGAIDSTSPPAAYHELRKHKGVTEELAFDRVANPSYFGTLLVQLGHAGGDHSPARVEPGTVADARARVHRRRHAGAEIGVPGAIAGSDGFSKILAVLVGSGQTAEIGSITRTLACNEEVHLFRSLLSDRRQSGYT